MKMTKWKTEAQVQFQMWDWNKGQSERLIFCVFFLIPFFAASNIVF